MRLALIAVSVSLLLGGTVSEQSTIPDTTAWRIFLNMKGEAPYAVKEAALRTASNAKRDVYAANYNTTAIAAEQANFDVQVATLVGQTQGGLNAMLSPAGFSRLNQAVERLKASVSIPVGTSAVRHEHPLLIPASFHPGEPQGTQMQYNYTQIGDYWANVTGWDSSGNPSGTAYIQLGLEGNTNPCSGPCLTATHTATAEYGHNGGGLQTEQLWSVRPHYSENNSYTWSWTFSDSSGYLWSPEYAFVTMTCSVAGTVINNNPLPVTSSPFKTETALTWATTIRQVIQTVTCFDGPGSTCPTTVQPILLYCKYCKYNPPDYSPTYFTFTALDGTEYMEFEEYGFCLGSTGGS